MPSSPTLLRRRLNARAAMALAKEGAHPLLARVLASRDITSMEAVSGRLKNLYHHSQMRGTQEASSLLADAISNSRHLLVVADYDCDGATACAVAVRGLRAMGANVNYVVPDRMVHGYGLTQSVVDMAFGRFPTTDILITVDNGVASHAGVEHALALGLDVVVTDHHLPAKGLPLPPANVIVDPSQPECTFPTKATAGVGVIWYVLWALQDELRRRRVQFRDPEFAVSSLLPLVAVGSVADVVPLDANNRVLVQAGLHRIRNGKSFPGIDALATVGAANKTNLAELQTSDIAFGIGPRINAAGRLETMDIGIECLLADNEDCAAMMAETLAGLNQARKDIERETVVSALEQAEAMVDLGAMTLAAHADEWHAGVIGIVAGRLKEKYYRPTFVLTTDCGSGQLKGSGRSIPGFNLKDALDHLDKNNPGLLVKFGGHAMAAGVTVCAGGFEAFKAAFEYEARKVLTPDILQQVLEHDGSLSGQELTPETSHALGNLPWGQMFPEPAFCDDFEVRQAKVIGSNKDQLVMVVERDGVTLRATKFRHAGSVPSGSVRLVYQLARHTNKFGREELRLLVAQVLS